MSRDDSPNAEVGHSASGSDRISCYCGDPATHFYRGVARCDYHAWTAGIRGMGSEDGDLLPSAFAGKPAKFALSPASRGARGSEKRSLHTDTDRSRPQCFNPNCDEAFDSVNEMVAVPGRGDRSPRHFCESCADRIRRGPPMTDGGTVGAGTDRPTVTVKWWAMGGLRTGEVPLENIESITVSPTAGGRNPFEIRFADGVMPQYCFAIEWPENTSIPNTGGED